MRSSTTLVRALREDCHLYQEQGAIHSLHSPLEKLIIHNQLMHFFSVQIKILLRLKITSKQNQFIGVGGIVCIDKPP